MYENLFFYGEINLVLYNTSNNNRIKLKHANRNHHHLHLNSDLKPRFCIIPFIKKNIYS